MNLFEIFHTSQYDNTPLFKHRGEDISLKKFKNIVASSVEFLNTQKPDRVVILSSGAFDFAVWFFACIFAGKQIFLLTDTSKLQYLDFDYVLADKAAMTEAAADFFKINPENLIINFYTSGSTSLPKNITKTLQNVIVEAHDIYDEFFAAQKNITKTQLKVLTSTRAQHMFAFTFYFVLPLCFLENLIIDTTEVCYPDDADFKDSVFISTPSFLEKFQKYGVKNSYSPVIIFSAGEKLNDTVFQYLEQNSKVVDIYGSTETGTIAYKNNSADKELTCLNKVKISTNENSQIVASSPYFMQEAITLGDIARIKDAKHFLLCGRADRIFKIQEKRVSAPEVENALMQASSGMISECYCFKSGEKLACAVVLTGKGKDFFISNNNSIAKLTSLFKNALNGKVEIIPQKWKFLYSLPRTKTGKIDAQVLEQIFKTNVSMPFVFDVQKDAQSAVFDITFPACCNFFEGHFNGFAVLPGVVQLYFAHFFAIEAFGKGVLSDCVKKIKFSKLIRPDENLKLIFERKNNLINYMYKRDEHICSSGVMTIDEKD